MNFFLNFVRIGDASKHAFDISKSKIRLKFQPKIVGKNCEQNCTLGNEKWAKNELVYQTK